MFLVLHFQLSPSLRGHLCPWQSVSPFDQAILGVRAINYAVPYFIVIARSEATWQSPIPYCQALLGVGDGGLPFRTSVLSTSLRGAKRRGNLPFYGSWGRVGDGGFDLHFCPGGKKYSIDQCLHWSKQHATGMLHLHGFESTFPPKQNKTKNPVR